MSSSGWVGHAHLNDLVSMPPGIRSEASIGILAPNTVEGAVSFSCPHYEFSDESCWRLNKPCVPGRPGCVLRKNSVFLVPAEERIQETDRTARDVRKGEDAAPAPG